jgi:hypothetical protein
VVIDYSAFHTDFDRFIAEIWGLRPNPMILRLYLPQGRPRLLVRDLLQTLHRPHHLLLVRDNKCGSVLTYAFPPVNVIIVCLYLYVDDFIAKEFLLDGVAVDLSRSYVKVFLFSKTLLVPSVTSLRSLSYHEHSLGTFF